MDLRLLLGIIDMVAVEVTVIITVVLQEIDRMVLILIRLFHKEEIEVSILDREIYHYILQQHLRI